VSRALALLAAATAGVAAAAGAAAQEGTSAHQEGCLVWSARGTVGVRNECSRPIAFLFMTFDDGKVSTAEIAPGGHFVADVEWGQPGGFMFTACPVGYKPNVAFSLENKEAISLSLYNCIGGRPAS
jgi:hypothetical protein